MRKLVYLFLAGVLVSCSGTKKVKPIIEFTQLIVPESTQKIELGEPVNPQNFANQLIYFKNHTSHVNLKEISGKYTSKIKVSSSKMLTAPYVHGSNVYTIDKKGLVTSANLETKKTNWTYGVASLKGDANKASLTVCNDKLVVTSDLQLTILDLNTGKEISKRSLDDIVMNQPVQFSNGFYVQNASNSLIAYSTDTWLPEWIFDTWNEPLSYSVVTSPVIASNQLITSYSSGQLISHNVVNGAEFWQINLLSDSSEALGYVPASLTCQPIHSGQFLYVSSNSGHLMKIDLSNASIVWKKKYEDITAMTVAGNTIFIANNARQIAAISIEDGNAIWATRALDQKDLEKSKKIKPALFTSPIISNGKLYIFNDKSEAFILDAYTGQRIKDFKIPEKINSVAIYLDKIFIFDQYNAYTID